MNIHGKLNSKPDLFLHFFIRALLLHSKSDFFACLQGRMLKTGPKITKIEIWPKSGPKMINSWNKALCPIFGDCLNYKSGLVTRNAIFCGPKTITFAQSARLWDQKNGASVGQIKVLRPLSLFKHSPNIASSFFISRIYHFWAPFWPIFNFLCWFPGLFLLSLLLSLSSLMIKVCVE